MTIPREDRHLSGADLGREARAFGCWATITGLSFRPGLVTVDLVQADLPHWAPTASFQVHPSFVIEVRGTGYPPDPAASATSLSQSEPAAPCGHVQGGHISCARPISPLLDHWPLPRP